MIRKLLFLIALTGCLGAPAAALGQASEPIVSEPPVEQPATRGGGALRHSADSTAFGTIGVYAGLSLLGCTLAVVVGQRRAALRTAATAAVPVHGGPGTGKYWVKPTLPRRRSAVAKESRPRGLPVKSRA